MIFFFNLKKFYGTFLIIPFNKILRKKDIELF
jgi:hypothetical protein